MAQRIVEPVGDYLKSVPLEELFRIRSLMQQFTSGVEAWQIEKECDRLIDLHYSIPHDKKVD